MADTHAHATTEPENTASAEPRMDVPEDLARCAMVIEHAIDHLRNEKFPPLAVASALLGGSLGVMARSMDKETILRILDSAAQSVRLGDVHASVMADGGSESDKA
ncbi:hypothetical protein [Acetobacter lambici]|uniref:Uncharacterized protein n=1 Tax=Acetobacter lambici TaxID=1332824 RepID=A0ABT1EXB6_9PROT|nr:hypothetical protein [Acetobacter lambici]MCP1241452.1 hypothetical protein [Acetobacter lambici]MCP1257576.1 hypothetical protein [Acetobacter lambici]